jgi:hypothetical protein
VIPRIFRALFRMPYDEQELKRIQDEEAEYARKAEERKKKRRVQGTLGAPAPAPPTLNPTVSVSMSQEPVAHLQEPPPPAHVPWYLLAAQEACKEVQEVPLVRGEMEWAETIAFASRAEATPGVRNAQRTSYLKCLQDLCAYVLSWQKDKSVKPLHLVGEIGCGKTSLLIALAEHCKLEVQLLQEVFLDPPSHDVIEQLGSQGLNRHPKLWVIEHFDTLTPQWRQALKRKGFSNMLRTGCIIMTSWPSSKQPSPNTLDLTPWTTDSKIKFLKTIRPHHSVKDIEYLLGESGDSMYGALECAKLWGSSLSNHVQACVLKEDSEYIPPPPVNLRLLLEESFTDRWSTARSLALETCDNELSLDLLQELTVGAAFQGRCDISCVAQQLDSLSHFDLATRKCPDLTKTVICQRLIQKQTLLNSRVSMSKFSTGTLIPLPQALLNVGKARTSAKAMDDLVLDARDFGEEVEQSRDTCKNLDDVQLFALASGRKWVSPFKTK